jgi:Pyruvate/2-oxoacid:ferredoxin oxidoreductase delta subunit
MRPPRRRILHPVATLLALVLALQLVPWGPAASLFPSLSPLLALGGALARRAFWPAAALGVPVLILAFRHKRWFCFHLCPTGFCAEAAGRLNRGSANRFAVWPKLGGWLAWLLLGGAAAGFPLALGLDPLALFNAFFSAWRRPLEAGLPPLAAGFLLVMAISLLRPHLWCLRLCPLGGLQDQLHALARLTRREPDPARRLFLGAAAGGAAALLLSRKSESSPVLRPPGAAPEASFKALCARCGACVKACPHAILHPDLGEAGLGGLLAPLVRYGKGYCFEQCKACTEVCATGAIRHLSLEQKRRLALGTAVVEKSRCLAWQDGLYCMVCQEFCPYSAIEAVEQKGVNCPVVVADRCRGCGACQNDCPAHPHKAITVRPNRQRELPD